MRFTQWRKISHNFSLSYVHISTLVNYFLILSTDYVKFLLWNFLFYLVIRSSSSHSFFFRCLFVCLSHIDKNKCVSFTQDTHRLYFLSSFVFTTSQSERTETQISEITFGSTWMISTNQYLFFRFFSLIHLALRISPSVSPWPSLSFTTSFDTKFCSFKDKNN